MPAAGHVPLLEKQCSVSRNRPVAATAVRSVCIIGAMRQADCGPRGVIHTCTCPSVQLHVQDALASVLIAGDRDGVIAHEYVSWIMHIDYA
jgi:hypothetical protein